MIYIDGRYYGNEGDCGRGPFSLERLEELADQLSCLKGRFMLSPNVHPDVRSVFDRFHLTEVRTIFSIGSKKTVEEAGRGELIIGNRRT